MKPERTTLKNTLLWCARWLLTGYGEQHREGLRVTIESTDGRNAVQFGEDSLLATDRIPNYYRQQTEHDLVDFVLRTFVSEEEALILYQLREGPKKAEAIINKTRFEKSRFAAIAGTLVQRGVLAMTAEGYEMSDPILLKIMSIRDEEEEFDASEAA
jgi:hypothetical protein